MKTGLIIMPNDARRIIKLAGQLAELAEQMDGMIQRRRRHRRPKAKSAVTVSKKPKQSRQLNFHTLKEALDKWEESGPRKTFPKHPSFQAECCS